MSLEIVRLDPFDVAAVDAWHAVYAAAEQHGRGEYAMDWRLEEMRAELQAPHEHREHAGYAALLDGVPVSVAELEFSLTDNLDRAWVRVYTAPGQRGNGY